MDSRSAFRVQIEEVVAADRLGDAIEGMLTVVQPGSPFRNELIGHMAEYQRISRAERIGLSHVQSAEDRRRLRLVLLELLADIVRQSPLDELPSFQQPVAAEVPEQASFEKIIGSNNLKKIAWLQLGLRCSMSVGRIVTPDGLGTGFLISGRAIVTNHHVIPTPMTAKLSTVDFNYQEDADGNMLEHFRYRLDAKSFACDPDKDVVVVGVAQSSKDPYLESWGSLDVSKSTKPAVGDHVSIIQHPNGGPKQIACTANQVVNIFEHRLQYLTDTLPGSSGAPVFDDDWRVVAIHHAGGNLKANSRGETRYVNEGILTSSVSELF
jgi:V8-like Glu-specific endopeptidase